MKYMKKVILIAALVVAAMPSMAQGLRYSVNGTYTGEGKKIYLMDQLTEKAIDSMVVAGGKFSFSGTAPKDASSGCQGGGQDLADAILQRRHPRGHQCQRQYADGFSDE